MLEHLINAEFEIFEARNNAETEEERAKLEEIRKQIDELKRQYV